MAITNKIKSLLEHQNKSSEGLAAHLGVSRQAIYNKYNRDSYSAEDLIRIADYLGVDLAFVVDDKQRVTLDVNDIKQKTVI